DVCPSDLASTRAAPPTGSSSRPTAPCPGDPVAPIHRTGDDLLRYGVEAAALSAVTAAARAPSSTLGATPPTTMRASRAIRSQRSRPTSSLTGRGPARRARPLGRPRNVAV